MAMHLIEQPPAEIVLFEQVAEAAHPGLVGTGSRLRSIPTERRITSESWSASSTPRSDRLNHCGRK
jgi:hypothetical protein